MSKAARIQDTTVEDFDKLFAVNVRAPYFLVQQLLPILRNGSSIVLVSSLAAHASVGTLSAYSATKGAVDTLVKHFAVAPGVIDTDMSNFAKTEDARSFIRLKALNCPRTDACGSSQRHRCRIASSGRESGRAEMKKFVRDFWC